MGKTERFYKIETIIRHRGSVSFEDLIDELEVSPATLKRDLQYLRDRLNAPIEYDRLSNGYRMTENVRGNRHELPGLWFSENELYSLLTVHQLLAGLDAQGLISRHIQPLQDRIHQLLGSGESEPRELMQRVKIVGSARRPVPSRFFELMGAALMKRLRVQMRYHSRSRAASSERKVSPQRLVHYRSTWYLDAWCHDSGGLRRFALDSVEDAHLLETRAIDVPLAEIEAELDGGYGIFTGGQVQWATLVFSAAAARWVSREEWHADQRAEWLPDGRYQLQLPYADATELAMDVLRHGDQVSVMPDSGPLFDVVSSQLKRAAALYAPSPTTDR
ncbi:WYL domain-containing protein [soil metagenome]